MNPLECYWSEYADIRCSFVLLVPLVLQPQAWPWERLMESHIS